MLRDGLVAVVISETAYLLLIVAVAGERCFELVLSRRNARLAFSRGGIEVGRRHYRVMVTVHVLFLLACAAGSLIRDRPFAPAVGVVALVGTIIAQALRYWTIVSLGKRWNTRVITVPGESPITGGPFRYLRHPNYLAVCVELLCLPMIRGLWITAIAFSAANAVLMCVRIPAEERALGAMYAAAFASRRRLIPKIVLSRPRAQP